MNSFIGWIGGKKATKGYNYRIYEVKNKWGRTSWGWINLSYTSKV